MDVIRRSAFSGAHYLDCKADKEVNMENLKATALIVPVIALVLIIILYLHLLKHSNNRNVFKRLCYLIIVSSFLLNFVWEIAQLPLYQGYAFDAKHIALCGLASVADAIMVLLLYFVFATLYKQPFWIKHINIQRSLMLIVIGGIGAILAELKHLSQDNWVYSSSMPIVPFVNVGLSPVLQFMFMPVLSYYLSFYFLKKNYGSQTN